jgi:hypothetical protein
VGDRGEMGRLHALRYELGIQSNAICQQSHTGRLGRYQRQASHPDARQSPQYTLISPNLSLPADDSPDGIFAERPVFAWK